MRSPCCLCFCIHPINIYMPESIFVKLYICIMTLESISTAHLINPSRKLKVEVILQLAVSQYVLVLSTLVGIATRCYFLSECCWLKFVVLFLWGSVITQWSELRGTHNHTLLSHLRLHQPEGPCSRIYIPQEQGGPVIPPGTGFPLRRLLRLAGLRWRCSNPPPTWRARSLYISFRNRMV
jgi:hypothetical protein